MDDIPELRDDEEGDDDALYITEVGRWRRDKRNKIEPTPSGLDAAYNAFDSEEGYTVQWNEVSFSHEENRQAFEYRLHLFQQIQHDNITRLYEFWRDTAQEKAQGRHVVVFITELMTSGTLRQYLVNTRKNQKTLQAKVWQRWCQQMLSALRYLHDCEPPLDHRKINAEHIYIQHNGLLKIGAVGLPGLRRNKQMGHIKVYDRKTTDVAEIKESCKRDIYYFGLVALEMITLEPPIDVQGALEMLDDKTYAKQKDFIRRCFQESSVRPSAHELLFHPAVFRVPMLKKQAAHTLIRWVMTQEAAEPEGDFEDRQERNMERLLQRYRAGMNPRLPCLGARVCRCFGVHIYDSKTKSYRSAIDILRKRESQLGVEKYLEDVRLGIYPLIVLEGRRRMLKLSLPASSLQQEDKDGAAGAAAAAASGAANGIESLRLEPDAAPEVLLSVVEKLHRFTVKFNLMENVDELGKQRVIRRCLKFDLEASENLAKTSATMMVQHGLLNQQDQAVMVKALSDALEFRVNHPTVEIASNMALSSNSSSTTTTTASTTTTTSATSTTNASYLLPSASRSLIFPVPENQELRQPLQTLRASVQLQPPPPQQQQPTPQQQGDTSPSKLVVANLA
eukprot:m.78857 g.78857  ORF g.78857 m.78857 type:complete len:620 (+) comp14765_c0_seq1:313-2172(+)